jgi:hypothetical protein
MTDADYEDYCTRNRLICDPNGHRQAYLEDLIVEDITI